MHAFAQQDHRFSNFQYLLIQCKCKLVALSIFLHFLYPKLILFEAQGVSIALLVDLQCLIFKHPEMHAFTQLDCTFYLFQIFYSSVSVSQRLFAFMCTFCILNQSCLNLRGLVLPYLQVPNTKFKDILECMHLRSQIADFLTFENHLIQVKCKLSALYIFIFFISQTNLVQS